MVPREDHDGYDRRRELQHEGWALRHRIGGDRLEWVGDVDELADRWQAQLVDEGRYAGWKDAA